MRPLGEGWGSTAYRVPDPGGDWALRVPRPQSFRQLTGDLERELRLLPALAAAGLPVPREGRAIRDREGRFVAALHRYVEGEPLARSRLRGVLRERFAGQLGRFFTCLHAFPPARAVALGVPELDLWEKRYRPMIDDCRPLLGPRTVEWLDATCERFLAAGGMAGAPRTLVHGDVAAPHLLVDGGALAGVIDFGDALVADPALDFGGLALAYRWPFTERALVHYGGAVDPHFRRRARFYVDVVPLFLVRYGHMFRGGEDRIDGLRQLAARAAAATRASATER